MTGWTTEPKPPEGPLLDEFNSAFAFTRSMADLIIGMAMPVSQLATLAAITAGIDDELAGDFMPILAGLEPVAMLFRSDDGDWYIVPLVTPNFRDGECLDMVKAMEMTQQFVDAIAKFHGSMHESHDRWGEPQ